MALLGGKKPEQEEPKLVEAEGHQLARLGEEAYRWLGARYLWYKKIRNAKKGAFPFLGGQNLEEQMEATRSALSMLARTLGAGMVVAFNATADSLGKLEEPPEGMPAKIDMPDRNNPPRMTNEQDALIVSFMPLRYLTQAKMLRDKGKGIDFYTEGLVKKLYFKVLGFYGDPSNWRADRLAFFLQDLPADAPLATINERLAPLKTELELLANTLQIFKFATPPRRKEAGTANTLDEAFEISPQDQVKDLYFQSLILNGLPNFLFRYYLTLLSAMKNPKGMRMISYVFLPVLAKAEEIRIRFQASFTMERSKISIRPTYQVFFKKVEALPMVVKTEVKGREVHKFNYTHKFLSLTGFPKGGAMSERHAKQWMEFFSREVVGQLESGRGCALLMEIMNMLLQHTRFSVQGKLEVVTALRKFGEEQEMMSHKIAAGKKKKLDEAKRNKLRSARKFKSTEQFDMVKTIEAEAEQLEAEGTREIEAINDAAAKRKAQLDERTRAMEETAKQEGESQPGRAAGAIFNLAVKADKEDRLRRMFVQYVLAFIQEDGELTYLDFYKNIFGAAPGLFPTEKVMLRQAVASRTELEDDEMAVSPEDIQAHEQQIVTMKTEVSMEAPGTLEQRFNHGPVNTTVSKLLDAALTQDSLRLVLSLPVNPPNKPAVKLPGPIVQKLLALNQLTHPFAANDVVLPNVEASEPVNKRINFNRLQKVV